MTDTTEKTEPRKGFQAYNLTGSGKKFTVYADTPRDAAKKLLNVMRENKSRSKEMRVNEGTHEGAFFVTRMAISSHGLSSATRSWKLPADLMGVAQLPEA